jgi:prenyltransferase beta subunit
MPPPTLREFVLHAVVDPDGRVPAVLGRNAADVVTSDRRLSDAALALLVLACPEAGPDDPDLVTTVRRLRGGLAQFDDPKVGGYHELLDADGALHPVGAVRTPATQALAHWARHRAAIVLGLAEEAAHSAEQLHALLTLVNRLNWPGLLDREATVVLDSGSCLDQVAVTVLAADSVAGPATGDTAPAWNAPGGATDRPSDWTALFDAAKSQLVRHLSRDGAWARCDAGGEPDRLSGYRVDATALAALAWCALHGRGHSDALDHARHLLRHVADRHQFPGVPGIWDCADADSQVRVDPVAAHHGRRRSPFPARLVADHALLLLATDRFLGIADDPWVEDLAGTAREEFGRYRDHGDGGVFHGLGSWFSTPVDPTVPLARHVMVSPATPGAFAVGNTSYVPFHEKQARTQLLALAAVDEHVPPAAPAPSVPTPRPAPRPLRVDLDRVATAPLSPDLIDVEAYLSWLGATRSGLGYGLTPYRSPLGLRSDRTAQIFSVLHVVSDLMTLGRPVPDPEGIAAGLRAAQNEDGGFAEQPGLLSEVFTTYCAVLTAYVLRARCFDEDRAAAFLLSCQHPEGGFGNAPGYPCDSWHTNLAVLALHALGRRPDREDDAIAYLTACRALSGGYAETPGGRPDAFATFRAVDSLIALGLQPPELDRTVSWLRLLQGDDGGFRYREGGPESFVGTYHAVAALYVVGEQPPDPATCIRWIAERQSSDGGFSRTQGGHSETTDEGFIAIQALHMLENKLNPYWAVIMT